jgi:hypothetical protein
MVVPVTICWPVKVNDVIPPQEIVANGRKKHKDVPTKMSREAIDF